MTGAWPGVSQDHNFENLHVLLST